jgi:hypothetical protein
MAAVDPQSEKVRLVVDEILEAVEAALAVDHRQQALLSDCRETRALHWADESNAVLELKQVREQGGLYGIGLKIDIDPPHLVQRVSNLKDPHGHSINDVRVGDALLLVNGQHVELGTIDALEKAILGPKGSTLNLAFTRMHPPKDPASQDLKWGPFSTSEDVYEVEVMRHVAIREWDEAHSWLELRQELRGRRLLADEEIVPVMESVRRCVVDRSNQALDFICEERVAMCSLGIHCAQEMGNGVNEIMDQSLRPNQIQVLVPGSPAHTSGKLKQGRSRFKSFFSLHHIPPISLPSPPPSMHACPRYAHCKNTRQCPSMLSKTVQQATKLLQ